jgi:hypothetical protein
MFEWEIGQKNVLQGHSGKPTSTVHPRTHTHCQASRPPHPPPQSPAPELFGLGGTPNKPPAGLMLTGSLLPDRKRQMRRYFAAAGQLFITSRWHNALALQEAASMKSSKSGTTSKFRGPAHSVMLLPQSLTLFGCPTTMNEGGVLTLSKRLNGNSSYQDQLSDGCSSR